MIGEPCAIVTVITLRQIEPIPNVGAQEVVPIEAGAADWDIEVEASMGAVEVVVMQPEVELDLPFERVLARECIGPFPQRDLDEAFRLAVGARRVGAGEAMWDMGLVEEPAEARVTIAGAVVGEHTADSEAEAGVKGAGHCGLSPSHPS